jgi:ribose-phosphate pyrophosphokinase
MLLVSANCKDIASPNIEMKRFPDGESYVRIPELESCKGKDVAVLHRCFPEQDASLFQLLQILRTLKPVARKVTAIVPYLPYARQDKTWLGGEAKTAEIVCWLLKEAGCSGLVTFDCHFLKKGPGKYEYAGLKITNITMGNAIIAEFRKTCPKAEVIAPDAGAAYLVEKEGGRSIKKVRGEYAEGKEAFRPVAKMEIDFEVKGSDVIILDDMLAGGGTMVQATKALKEKGAGKVLCGATHGLFVGCGLQKIREAGADEIIVSDSILTEVSKVKIKSELRAYLG